MTINKVFIGYDSKETEAYEVCKYSIEKYNKNKNLEIIPIVKKDLISKGIYKNCESGLSSTEFSFTRFLVPYLSNYSGWSVFVDCDFIFLDDINSISSFLDTTHTLFVVKHDYTPKTDKKMESKIQTIYPRKNWSSLMVFNCEHTSIKTLTPDLINTSSGLYLHRFMWLDDKFIGNLPYKFNFLVGYYDKNTVSPIGVHFTDGGPWLDSYKDVEFSAEYFKLLKEYKNGIRN